MQTAIACSDPAETTDASQVFRNLFSYWLFALALGINLLTALWTRAPWTGLTSLVLFVWLILLAFRHEQRGSAIFLPFLVNRGSVVVSLIVVAYGAHIPELGLYGEPGPQAATYVIYCVFLVLGYCWTFRRINPVGRPAAGPLLPPGLRAAMGFGLVLACGLLGLYAFFRGLQSGFPLLTQTDRFLFRMFYADKIVVYMLNLKFVLAVGLGMVAFNKDFGWWLRLLAAGVFLVTTGEYFLYGDKFFTILANACFFLMPWLSNPAVKSPYLSVKGYLVAGAAMAVALSMTWYIYSDYGKRGSYETFQKLAERISGQGELWYIAGREDQPIWHWDQQLVGQTAKAMTLSDPDLFALREGLGTFYFSNRYAPPDIRDSIYRNAGRVSFTMGQEPFGLVLFGYGGLVIVMLLTGALVALAASYMYRAVAAQAMISAVLACFILTSFLYATNQGTPWVALGLIKMKWYALILLAELGFLLARTAARRQV